MQKIYFGGSRSLSPSPVLAQVVGAVVAAGQSVHVGCCTGADQAVITCAPASSLRVFAAFAPHGSGSCSASAVSVVQSFAAAGGSVSWLAGGAFTLPLAARLIRRSQAALSSCSAAVFFAPGQGSLAVAAHAVAAGIPVFAFTQAMPAPIPHTAGAWVAGSFSGFSCWSFQVAQINLF